LRNSTNAMRNPGQPPTVGDGVKVEIWSDVVCPWCYIGKRRFEQALAEFDGRDEVEVVWRSFELDPGAPREQNSPSADLLARKYGMTVEQARASEARLAEVAAGEGLEYRLAETRRGNSFDAHRLLHLALEQGKQDELKERLLRAYFAEGEAIGSPEVLARLAEEVGVTGAAEVLDSDRFAEEVQADERRAQLLGIHAVPFFVIDERYGIEGAQPAELITRALEQARAERVAVA
jgi:predicted DsbA family dithiol-disulfide isomerase